MESYTLCLDSRDKKKYGTDEALFLYGIRHWIRLNQKNKRNYRDGRYWSYNSLEALMVMFDYTKSQIERITNNLKRDGILLTGNYNKRGYDRTIWYSLNEPWTAEEAPSNQGNDDVEADYGSFPENKKSFPENKKSFPENKTTIPKKDTTPGDDTKDQYDFPESIDINLKRMEAAKREVASGHMPSREDLKEIFNDCVKGSSIPSLRVINDERFKAFKDVHKVYFKSIEEFRAFLYRVAKSDFLNGKLNSNKHRNWVADFDYLIKEKVVIQTLEGKFDNKKKILNYELKKHLKEECST